MSAGVLALSCEQGTTFHRVITWTDSTAVPVDLTGCTAHFEVAVGYGSDYPVLADLVDGLGLTLGGIAGTILVDISATDTALLERGGVYALTVTFPDGRAIRVLEGDFLLSLGAP